MNAPAPQAGASPRSAVAPIRVVFLAPKLGLGGMTRYLVELGTALAGRGHAARVVTVDGPGIAHFAGELRAAGVEVDVVRSLSRKAMRGALHAHRAECIKLFTGAFPPDSRLTVRLLGTGVPIVESIHVMPARGRVTFAQRACFALHRSARSAVVVFTAELEAEARARIPALRGRIHRVRYGMRLPELRPRTASAGRECRFVSVCRLDAAQKDVATLIRAVRMVRDGWDPAHGPAPKVTIAGDGPDRARLVALVRETGVEEAVEFPGWVDDPVELVRGADVLVLSTRRESPGRVIVEASAVGVPVIASRVEGCTESVADGRTGMLVEPGSPRALADAMAILATDSVLRARLGAAGPAHARAYAMEAHADRIVALLDTARTRRGRGAQ